MARARVLWRARAGRVRGRAAGGREAGAQVIGPRTRDGTAGVSGAALSVRAGSADGPGARRGHRRRAGSGTQRGWCVSDQLCVRLAALRCSAVSPGLYGLAGAPGRKSRLDAHDTHRVTPFHSGELASVLADKSARLSRCPTEC